jgi:hypothetical protein
MPQQKPNIKTPDIKHLIVKEKGNSISFLFYIIENENEQLMKKSILYFFVFISLLILVYVLKTKVLSFLSRK